MQSSRVIFFIISVTTDENSEVYKYSTYKKAFINTVLREGDAKCELSPGPAFIYLVLLLFCNNNGFHVLRPLFCTKLRAIIYCYEIN